MPSGKPLYLIEDCILQLRHNSLLVGSQYSGSCSSLDCYPHKGLGTLIEFLYSIFFLYFWLVQIAGSLLLEGLIDTSRCYTEGPSIFACESLLSNIVQHCLKMAPSHTRLPILKPLLKASLVAALPFGACRDHSPSNNSVCERNSNNVPTFLGIWEENGANDTHRGPGGNSPSKFPVVWHRALNLGLYLSQNFPSLQIVL